MFKKKLSAEIQFEVVFACENVKWKQELLTELGIPTVYPCVHIAAAEDDRHVPNIKGETKRMSNVDLLIFAIECDTISRFAKGWSERLGCIEEALNGKESRTGSTAVSCMRIVERLQPPLFVAECVRALTMKDSTTKKKCI